MVGSAGGGSIGVGSCSGGRRCLKLLGWKHPYASSVCFTGRWSTGFVSSSGSRIDPGVGLGVGPGLLLGFGLRSRLLRRESLGSGRS